MKASLRSQPTFRSQKWLAVLCLLLVSVVSVAQVAHDHQNDAKAAQHCSVCFAAHSPSAKAVVLFVPPTQTRHGAMAVESESVTSLLLAENLYIRPPPVA